MKLHGAVLQVDEAAAGPPKRFLSWQDMRDMHASLSRLEIQMDLWSLANVLEAQQQLRFVMDSANCGVFITPAGLQVANLAQSLQCICITARLQSSHRNCLIIRS